MNYEEKLRLAKEALESGSYDTETIEYIFPELRESEDEKIRNEICIYIGAKQDISLDTHNRWLAWLEKQGESKFEQCIQESDKIVTNEDGTHFNVSQLERVAKKESAWSEEDESILQGIWDEILANKHDAKEYEWKTYDKFLNWLKSLKERMKGE